MPTSENNSTLAPADKQEPVPFDTTYCDLKTKVLFEEWGTIAAVRIMAFVQTRQGQGIFSLRGIGIITHLSKSTVDRTLQLLVEKRYLLRKDNRYYANNQMEVSRERDSVPESAKTVPETKKSVPLLGHNNQYNNQNKYNTNSSNLGSRSSHPAYRVENSMPWEREGFKKEEMSKEERKALLEAKGFK